MRWSLKLGSISGIGIFVHWTFFLLIGWLVYANWGTGAADIALVVGFVVAVFACVVLHELGHALTAQRFGVATRDIILLPIGGVARLERMPQDPRQELLIAAAGPAVNVVIAVAIYAAIWAFAIRAPGRSIDSVAHPLLGSILEDGFFRTLAYVNLFLVGFNLLPAFPMDGGRMLRAALAYRMDYASATRVAAGVGQVMAGIFFFVGLLFSPMLLLIGVFVFLGAQAEAQMAELRWNMNDVPVRDAMVTHFATLSEHSTLREASELLLGGPQEDFPVVEGERIVGVLARGDLLRALASRGMEAPVGEVMRRDCGSVDELAPLTRVFERMQTTTCPLVPVTRAGELVGILTLEKIGEFLMVRSALRGRHPASQRTMHDEQIRRAG